MGEPRSPTASYYECRYKTGTDRWSTNDTISRIVIEDLVKQSFDPVASELRVLDVGCGRLGFAFRLCTSLPTATVTAIDYVLDAILNRDPNLATDAARFGISCINGDFLRFPLVETFDIVVDLGFLHHLVPADWAPYASKVASVLRNAGSYYVSTYAIGDRHWPIAASGGHVRNGYYCHYHDSKSLLSLFAGLFRECRQVSVVDLAGHRFHIFALRR